ncbi:MAG: class I SAM-dependent methyltransferase [Phycisphaerae bacterium]|nr:class I SAM-dependent methyltransferase [Gemmatimonadaceae bacterium]
MVFSRRLHGIELLDIPRCPRAIRDGALDYLQFIIRSGNAYAPTVPVLAAALKNRNVTSIVDVCSGGGGPWPQLRQALVAAGAPANLRVTLTDLYPNIEAFAKNRETDSQVSGETAPIDIENSRIPLQGLRTSFSSFHHFSPGVARQVLRNLAHGGEGVFIAEVTERGAKAVLFMLLAPLLVWLATPQLRPFKWSRLLLTYIIPVIPFVVCCDGIVSCLRTYSPDEMRALFTSVEDLNYEWEVGLLPAPGRLSVTYALGFPKAREA